MITRREVLGGGGVMAALAGGAPVEARGAVALQDDARVVNKLDEILREMRGQGQGCAAGGCPAVRQFREQQKVFLRANGRFPQFIDVGIDVWESLYDWHVLRLQPLNVVRLPDARYGLTFMTTTAMLRTDAAPNFIGLGYDKG